MNRLCWLIGLLSIAISAGCNYDIVTTPRWFRYTFFGCATRFVLSNSVFVSNADLR